VAAAATPLVSGTGILTRAQETTDLTAAEQKKLFALRSRDGIVSASAITLDLKALSSTTISITLSDGKTYEFVGKKEPASTGEVVGDKRSNTSIDGNTYVWTGTGPGDSWAVLSVNGKHVSGRITVPPRTYPIQSLSARVHVITEYRPTRKAGDDTPKPSDAASQPPFGK
jgi:hypothetical protein